MSWLSLGLPLLSRPPSRLATSNTCNSGSVNCCQSVQSIIELFGYLGIPLPGGNTQIGLTCSPVTVGGTSTGSICTQQTVCCTGNSFVSPSCRSHFACTPSDVGLEHAQYWCQHCLLSHQHQLVMASSVWQYDRK
ncbi:hypothetical protein JVT61DRAFT_8335 [Boletus reticuloceps]|uniref:Hydrophobin n=1 Tax=Boletus reticuloceps TaxID=495285 RepID=A0A8I3ACE1_9AGAM|nr:hypothetical protein JVT61DRAFT_8335 [Boletus reticuloceps]